MDGTKKYARVAYGIDSKYTQVHEDFKFILIQNQKNYCKSDPPLLNRFEKHMLTCDDVIHQEVDQFNDFRSWMQKIHPEEPFFSYIGMTMLYQIFLQGLKKEVKGVDLKNYCKNQILKLMSYKIIVKL